MLVLAYYCNAHESCTFTRAEWLHGLSALRCVDSHRLPRWANPVTNSASAGAARWSSSPRSCPAFGSSWRTWRPWGGCTASPLASPALPASGPWVRSYRGDERRGEAWEAGSGVAISAKHGRAPNSASPLCAELESAVVLWELLLHRRLADLGPWLAFLRQQCKHAIPKDTWDLVFEFFRETKGAIASYDCSDSWPALIDEFVEWSQASA